MLASNGSVHSDKRLGASEDVVELETGRFTPYGVTECLRKCLWDILGDGAETLKLLALERLPVRVPILFVYKRYLGMKSRMHLRLRYDWTSPQNGRFVLGFGARQQSRRVVQRMKRGALIP